MPRDTGFPVMDVSTDIINDPKVRKLFRLYPGLAAPAFFAFTATMAESWKAGRRVPIDDAWPAVLPYDEDIPPALRHVGLLDSSGRVPTKSWSSWFAGAHDRREKARERWRRYNAKREADTTDVPRGSDVGTATSVPTVPSVRPNLPSGLSPARPTLPKAGRGNGRLEQTGDILADMVIVEAEAG